MFPISINRSRYSGVVRFNFLFVFSCIRIVIGSLRIVMFIVLFVMLFRVSEWFSTRTVK